MAVFCLLLTVGCVISPRRTLGGGGGTPTPRQPHRLANSNSAGEGKLYVMDTNASAIFRFDNAFTANGNLQPAATITGAATTIHGAGFMTLDTAHDSLYIANTQDLSVIIYDGVSTKNGNVAPSRNYRWSCHGFDPTDVSLDKVKEPCFMSPMALMYLYMRRLQL